MLLRCVVLLLFLSCVRTSELNDVEISDFNRRLSYSFWPSAHNGAVMMRIRKRQVEEGPSEGGVVKQQVGEVTPAPTLSNKNPIINSKAEQPKVPGNVTANTNETVTTPPVTANDTKANDTAPIKSTGMDINNPGVLKRGLIVFGGFALMAVAYFIFYRRKSSKNTNSSSTHNINDGNQFRYGVLQTDDRRDNLELSRIPLTMESDEDEDEDLEIFDLEQKKKSLSYVNLQVHDEDVVLNSPTESSRANDRDNLLLDIEDASSDTLINWSNSGNKSIL